MRGVGFICGVFRASVMFRASIVSRASILSRFSVAMSGGRGEGVFAMFGLAIITPRVIAPAWRRAGVSGL